MEVPSGKARPEAAALVVGSEILSGKTVDTNTFLLIETLMGRGVRLKRWLAVPDDRSSIISELTRLILEGFDPVFVSGGMGPTHDDITVEAVASALSMPLVHDSASEGRLQDRWHRLNPGKEMPEASLAGIRKMSLVPEGFGTIPNKAGMAEGLWGRVEGDRALIVILPGVPAEYRSILLSMDMDQLLPRGEGVHIAEVEFKGRESQVAALLKGLQGSNQDVEIGCYPQGPMNIVIRLTGGRERTALVRSELERLLEAIN